jgi:limonene-1,2-epoxide hydrolase
MNKGAAKKGKEMGVEKPVGGSVIELVIRFNEALNRQDVEAMMRLMTEDCVFENTAPPPEGTRHDGQKAVQAVWEEFFRSSQEPGIEIEEIFAAGERCVMRWVYHWVGLQGEPGHIRGVDIYKLRGEKIAEKLSYVKG